MIVKVDRRQTVLKEWLELADNLDDHGRDLIERIDGTPIPINSYCRGYVSCQVHVRVGKPDWEFGPHDFCAEFCLWAGDDSGAPGLRESASKHEYEHADVVMGRGVRRYRQADRQAVFVRAGKIAEHGKGMEVQADREFFVDSVVSLIPLDDCDMGGGHLPKVSFLCFREPLAGIGYRKVDAAGFLNVSASVQGCKLKHQMIEGGDQIVHHVSDDNLASWNKVAEIRHVIDKEDMLAGFRIELNSKTWKIVLD